MVLGLILVVIAVAFAVGIFIGHGPSTQVGWYELTFDGQSPVTVYLAGMSTALLLLLGIWLVEHGMRKRRRRRERSAHGGGR